MLKVLSSILCDLDPKVKVLGQKAGICDGVPSTSALVLIMLLSIQPVKIPEKITVFLIILVESSIFVGRAKMPKKGILIQ